jgi:small multidrug resistance pump
VYAIWSGVGIILISILGVIFFNNIFDIPGILGLSLIIAGVIILNLFSKMSQ